MNRRELFRLPPVRIEAAAPRARERIDWGLAALGVPEVWKETQGAGVRVAVLDTGIDAEHPDLAGAVLASADFADSRQGARDVDGHGTHCAGVIAARANGLGVVGVAPQCELLVGKVLGDEGFGSDGAVADGIAWAVAQGADILSLSLGSPQASRRIATAIDAAVAAGRFVICAAGNEGRPNSVDFPARLPSVVAVGAVDRHGRVAPFSSRGDEVDVCAPGEDVLSCWPRGGYAQLSGTSMATPFVAGVVALLLAKHRRQGGATPVVTPAQLIEHLQRTAIDAGPAGRDPSYGFGLVNPRSVLAASASAPQVRIGPLTVNGVAGDLVFVPRAA